MPTVGKKVAAIFAKYDAKKKAQAQAKKGGK